MKMLGGSFKPKNIGKILNRLSNTPYQMVFNKTGHSTVQMICKINKKRFLVKWTGKQI